MANFNDIVSKTFSFEGGYQAFANDTANVCNGNVIGTNHGISAIAYKQVLGRCPTVDEMKALTVDQAKNIYKGQFWNPLQGDAIKDQSLAHIMFDAYIASGGTGLKRVKQAINTVGKVFPVVDTSPITPGQAAAINALNTQKLFDVIKAGEINNRKQLAAADPDKYGIFLTGWLNRLNSITYSGVFFLKTNWVKIALLGASALALTTILILTTKKAAT